MSHSFSTDRLLVRVYINEATKVRSVHKSTTVADFLLGIVDALGIESCEKNVNYFFLSVVPHEWKNNDVVFQKLCGDHLLLECLVLPNFVGQITRQNWRDASVLYATHDLVCMLNPSVAFLQVLPCWVLQHVQAEQVRLNVDGSLVDLACIKSWKSMVSCVQIGAPCIFAFWTNYCT